MALQVTDRGRLFGILSNMTFHNAISRVLRASCGLQVVPLSLFTLLNGCATGWKVRPAAPQEVLRSTGETEVQVVLTTGARIVLRDPGVEGDSLIGWAKPKGTELPEREAFALSDVRALATKQNNLPLNIALGLVTGTAVALSLYGALLVLCYAAECD